MSRTTHPTIRSFADAEAYFAGARSKANGRPLANNTRLYERTVYFEGEPVRAFAVQLHWTDVVTYLENGLVILNSGGYRSVTTADRLNSFSPARVYTEIERLEDGTTVKGWNDRPSKTWVIASSEPEFTTPPKVQKCRSCKGTGTSVTTTTHGYAYELGHEGDWNHVIRWIEFQKPEVRENECGRCDEGRKDYGSHQVHPTFFDGIIVDSNGQVVDRQKESDLVRSAAA